MNLKHKFPDKSPKTAFRVMDGEAVVVIPEDNEVKILNEVGSRVWELIDGNRDITKITSLICNEFDISHETAREDIMKFIDELYHKKMVILLDSPNTQEGKCT